MRHTEMGSEVIRRDCVPGLCAGTVRVDDGGAPAGRPRRRVGRARRGA
eukprot:COSAG03_NODE_28041_length_234_cov_59.822222_1_plen_47_part_01